VSEITSIGMTRRSTALVEEANAGMVNKLVRDTDNDLEENEEAKDRRLQMMLSMVMAALGVVMKRK